MATMNSNHHDTRKNKLILHFDARNTLFVADYNSKLTAEKALNTYISGLAWGVEENNEWKLTKHELSCCTPSNNSNMISYYKFMEKNIVKTANDRQLLRETLGKFTQENGKEFEQTFNKYIKLLQWNFPPNELLTVKGDSGKLFHYILPTFFHLLEWLAENERDFAIIIRTYGYDIPHILKATNQFILGNHPHFPKPHNIKINLNPNNSLTMTDNGYLYNYHDPDFSCSKEQDIVEHWNQLEGVLGVRDDFNYWLKNNYNYKSSKPLWINNKSKLSSDNYLHIFFDDCIRPRDFDSIVHLRRFPRDLSDSITNKSEILLPEETLKLIDVNLVQSELLTCINDHKYFIKKIQKCETNFQKIL